MAESQFSIPRTRVKLTGNAFTTALHYKIEIDAGKRFLSLKDAYIAYDLAGGWLGLRAGQFKKAFSRQQITSSGKLDLVDRAITDKAFGAGRDIGVELRGGDESNGLQWSAAVFNGTTDKTVFQGSATPASDGSPLPVTGKFTNLPVVFMPMAVARLMFGYGGIKALSEGDLEGGPLRFAVGSSVYSKLDTAEDPGGRTAGEVDGILKLHGFSTTGGLYASLAGGPAGNTPEAVGAHLQASYVIGDYFRPALRWAAVQPLTEGSELQQEIAVAMSVDLFGHSAKWTTEVATFLEGAARPDLRALTQLQLGF